MENEDLSNYRYERKFVFGGKSLPEIERGIKFHPAIFKEIFYERHVNNIYFDTIGLKNYRENIEGISNRYKVRIRWYGKLFGKITDPTLEIKVKKGLLGKKISIKLDNFVLDEDTSKQELISLIDDKCKYDLRVKKMLLNIEPAVINTYTRKYFISHDKKFRITLDYDLAFYRTGNTKGFSLNKQFDKKTRIIELKYKSSDNSSAKFITDNFNLRLGPSSKYTKGIDSVRF